MITLAVTAITAIRTIASSRLLLVVGGEPTTTVVPLRASTGIPPQTVWPETTTWLAELHEPSVAYSMDDWLVNLEFVMHTVAVPWESPVIWTS
jgi:hypothetical protein